ncbi:PAS domain-containing protein, partial [bacterium]|nr:PAS domain-containing protein [bacterium]
MSKKGNPDHIKKTSQEVFLIESLEILVDGIARTFGSRCEVVLHDLRNLRNLCIVKIANGHVTGRTIGGPVTDEGLRHLRSGHWEKLLINYPTVTTDGRHLKSSTITLANDKEEPIFAICINSDVTDILNFNVVIQDMLAISDDIYQHKPAETFHSDKFSTLNGMADKEIRQSGKTVPTMTRKDKIELIKKLENQGFFLIKGAVGIIAQKLNVSKFTIYNYIQQARSENQSKEGGE